MHHLLKAYLQIMKIFPMTLHKGKNVNGIKSGEKGGRVITNPGYLDVTIINMGLHIITYPSLKQIDMSKVHHLALDLA